VNSPAISAGFFVFLHFKSVVNRWKEKGLKL